MSYHELPLGPGMLSILLTRSMEPSPAAFKIFMLKFFVHRQRGVVAEWSKALR